MRVWRIYAWGDCPRCDAITDEPCMDLRKRSRPYMWGGTIHRDRPAYDVTDTPAGATLPE